MQSHGFPYLPVPVGTQTITPALPDAQHKPGKSSQQHSDQMPSSCVRKCPANDIEYGECCMKDEEENIEEGVSHFYTGKLSKDRVDLKYCCNPCMGPGFGNTGINIPGSKIKLRGKDWVK